jgi:hypothetical protein
MQIRHIRPGSLDWQDAKIEEVDHGFQRLSPEEISRLRKQSEDRRQEQKGEDGKLVQPIQVQ